eukprot:scaffold860_cov111-Cylindrotheca_fusiformis.AAC.1
MRTNATTTIMMMPIPSHEAFSQNVDFGLSLRLAPRKIRDSRRDDMVKMKSRRCVQHDTLMLPSPRDPLIQASKTQ